MIRRVLSLCAWVLLTKNISEPQGQVLFHGQQAGFVSTGQPLVVLLHVCEARATGLFGAQGAAHGALRTAWGRRGGVRQDTRSLLRQWHNVNLQCELKGTPEMHLNYCTLIEEWTVTVSLSCLINSVELFGSDFVVVLVWTTSYRGWPPCYQPFFMHMS